MNPGNRPLITCMIRCRGPKPLTIHGGPALEPFSSTFQGADPTPFGPRACDIGALDWAVCQSPGLPGLLTHSLHHSCLSMCLGASVRVQYALSSAMRGTSICKYDLLGSVPGWVGEGLSCRPGKATGWGWL